jgi:hypothetical protein
MSDSAITSRREKFLGRSRAIDLVLELRADFASIICPRGIRALKKAKHSLTAHFTWA